MISSPHNQVLTPSSMAPRQPMQSDHRLKHWAPTIYRFARNPTAALLLASIPSMFLLLISAHWAMVSLFVYGTFLVYKLDRELNNRFLIPPIGLLVLPSFIGIGIGVPMLASSMNTWFDPLLFTIQLVALLGLPFTMLGYLLGRGRISANWFPQESKTIIDRNSKSIVRLGVILLGFDLVRMIVGWKTGSLDRGFAGEVVLEQSIGIWTFPAIFGRWTNLWFFFVPVLWRASNALGRVLLSGVLIFYGLIAYASGSRGLLLFPVIFVLIGIYFFVDEPKFKAEKWILLLAPLFAFYIYTVDIFRNTAQFQNSRLSDLPTRLAASKAIGQNINDWDDFLSTTGKALIGVSDSYVYQATPEVVPYAGGSDLWEAFLWTWVPQKLYADKPLLIDGNNVVEVYSNYSSERSGATISLACDCYRRFGWVAVIVGLFAMGSIFGFAVRGVIRVLRYKSIAGGLALVALLVGGFQTGFTNTVLTTWWIWAYDLPKHVVATGVIAFLVAGGFDGGVESFKRLGRRE